MQTERSYRILVRDFVLLCSIGAYPDERLKRQRVRFNVDLRALWPSGTFEDELEQVVNYKDITTSIRELVEEGHINLVETLAERVADSCFADPRVLEVRVMVEKLDVEPAADGLGVEIERRRSSHPAAADLFDRPDPSDPTPRSGGR